MFPLVLLVLLGVAQAALWAHANSVVQAAAAHGAEIAGSYGATAADGEEAAATFVETAGNIDARLVQVQSAEGAGTVTVTVAAPFAFLFGEMSVRAEAVVVKERLEAP